MITASTIENPQFNRHCRRRQSNSPIAGHVPIRDRGSFLYVLTQNHRRDRRYFIARCSLTRNGRNAGDYVGGDPYRPNLVCLASYEVVGPAPPIFPASSFHPTERPVKQPPKDAARAVLFCLSASSDRCCVGLGRWTGLECLTHAPGGQNEDTRRVAPHGVTPRPLVSKTNVQQHLSERTGEPLRSNTKQTLSPPSSNARGGS